MFKAIFLYEIRYRLARPATWIYFVILFLMTFIATTTDSVMIGGSIGNIMRNSPYVIANSLVIISAFAMIITTAIMSTAIYRDFETQSHTLFFTLPLRKWQYIGGRFFGALAIAILVFASLPLGIMLGSVMAPGFGWGWMPKNSTVFIYGIFCIRLFLL